MIKTWKSVLTLTILGAVLLSGCAPDAVDSFGRPIHMSNYRGRWVVINYWASWCVPCIKEIPELNKLATYYRRQVVVFGVNVDGIDNMALQNLMNGYQAQYAFLRHFPIERWGGKLQNIPVTFIIDPKGRLYKTLYGPQTLATFQAAMSLPAASENN